ncbi:MAG TPA: bifunctional 3-(3-hydroxy-phenyl)propionate/3-hydroxycinnamic acid hydroxylase [Acidimicrobiia bacterium]|jgi:3-(3-hydroxy-phenyl)propionate hydroxylase
MSEGPRGAVAEPADVLVIGFGPVGATLTGLAAGYGLSVVAVDPSTELYPLPRAAHCDHEILRILQQLGCADEIVTAMRVNEGMDFLSASREVLLRFQSRGLAPTGWPASVLFHQPGFEGAIRRAVAGTDADVRLGAGVAALDAGDDAVRATLDDGSTVAARYAVGCDGARSMVRRAIGSGVHDLEFEEPWLVIDVVLREQVPGLPDRALQVCDPARPHTLVPMPWPRFRFEFMLLDGEDPDAMQQPDRARELMAAWIDPGAVDVERSAVYTFHGLVAERWRSGRVFLAGDAAHQMPPFLGQGMCSGMRDAANLSWKLAAVLHDGAPDALLDTYQSEREPHVRTIVEQAVGFGRIICTTDAAVAAARDADLLAAPHDNDAAPTEPPPLNPLTPGPAIGPGGGALAAQPLVDGRRLDDLVGPRFLVATAEPMAAGDHDRLWWAHRAALFDARSTPEVGALLGSADAIVVRPDRYVFARGDLAPLTQAAQAVLESAVPVHARQRVR